MKYLSETSFSASQPKRLLSKILFTASLIEVNGLIRTKDDGLFTLARYVEGPEPMHLPIRMMLSSLIFIIFVRNLYIIVAS